MKISPTVVLSRPITGLSERALAKFVVEACGAVRLNRMPSLLITSSRRMRGLNAEFRGKDYPTDVLSFPSPSFVEGFSGDIAVSADIAARNARTLGHSVGAEIKILILHGILHLAGYDHESDNGEMAAKESHLRQKLGLPAALIERAAVKRRPRAKTRTRT